MTLHTNDLLRKHDGEKRVENINFRITSFVNRSLNRPIQNLTKLFFDQKKLAKKLLDYNSVRLNFGVKKVIKYRRLNRRFNSKML